MRITIISDVDASNTRVVSLNTLATELAEYYNNKIVAWSHSQGLSGRVDADEVATKLECNVWWPRNFRQAIDFYHSENESKTIEEWAVMVADMVAQLHTKHEFNFITFNIETK